MHLTTSWTENKAVFAALIALLITVGAFRIHATYPAFWETNDEGFHVTAGMEWLARGQYSYEPFHPPLARVMCALGPYLAGARGTSRTISKKEADDEGYVILNSKGQYEHNLALARTGVLPFFVLASLMVAFWTRRIAGPTAALLATLFFTTAPPVLAHAGLATLDMVCTAMVVTALCTALTWLKKPTLPQSCLFGFAVGGAVLAKFSTIGFVFGPTLLAGAFLWRSPDGEPCTDWASRRKKWALPVGAAALTFLLTVWGGYRFSFDYLISAAHGPYPEIDHFVGPTGRLHDWIYAVLQHTPLPAPAFFKGIGTFLARNKDGHLAYFLGEIRQTGWWYYFPTLLAVKTPIPLLVCAGYGLVHFLRRATVKEMAALEKSGPVLALVVILCLGMVAKVDNGVRQLLSIYPLLAIIAGFGAAALFNSRQRAIALLLVPGLILWQIQSSCAAHPDYLAYFNAFGAGHPSYFGVDSDLDWGQDFKRLQASLRRRGIKELYIDAEDSVLLQAAHADVPILHDLPPRQKVTGWVAISLRHLFLGTAQAPYDQFRWLKDVAPVEKVGPSILLYYIPR